MGCQTVWLLRWRALVPRILHGYELLMVRSVVLELRHSAWLKQTMRGRLGCGQSLDLTPPHGRVVGGHVSAACTRR
jgi:hypothetical protein